MPFKILCPEPCDIFTKTKTKGKNNTETTRTWIWKKN
nr:hypothetical protein [Sicyoidochytrium minutum DNA virus]